MTGQPGLGDVSQDVARAPADERIDLDPLALGLEQGQPRTIGGRKPFLPVIQAS